MGKNLKILVFMISLFCAILSLSCSGGKTDVSSNVSGSWSSNQSVDGLSEVIATSSPYRLSLNKTANLLSGELHFPAEQGGNTYILTGTESAEGISLVGSSGQENLSLSGKLINGDSLELVVEIASEQIIHLLCFRDKEASTVKLINENSLGKKCGGETSPVILIHGMDNDATIWNEMIGRFQTDGTCDRHAVWVYQYDWLKHIYLNGSNLAALIAIVYNSTGELSEPPIIIAHSMGGLVSRSYVAQGNPLAGLITLGTPHQGSPLADFTYIFPWALGTGVADLRPGSDFLKELNSNSHETTQRSKYVLINGSVYSTWVCTRHIGKYCYWGYWEWSGDYSHEIKAGYGVMEKPNDGMVPQSSARFEGDSNVTRVDTFSGIDHMSLNQPSQSEDIYKYIRDYLRSH